jgi:hypothetical protein
MDTKERERIIELINNPPPGSKLAAARDFGIDLTLFLHSLELSPEQRLQELDAVQPFLEELRRTGKRQGSMVILERILRVLDDAQVKFVVIGGVAMYARGSARLTRDLDVCYERSPQNIERLACALAPYHPRLRGAPPDLPFTLDGRAISAGMNFTLTTDLGDLDLLGEVAGLGQYREVKAHASPVTVEGRPCHALTAEGLIRAKRATGRPRDLEAVQELEALAELERGSDETPAKSGDE